jgi:hypothetical protein
MPFPDDYDKRLQNDADQTMNFAEDLANWVLDHGKNRRDSEGGRISEEQELRLLQLRRLAVNLRGSTKVPAAAAVYGASQTGKSLFVGRVVQPAQERVSPLGISDKQEGYHRELDFTQDINPQSGSNEATALVTRFSTGNRLSTDRPPLGYSITVRALTRSEWLKVLGRGFLSECILPPDFTWTNDNVESLLASLMEQYSSDTSDRHWRLDLVDAFSDLRRCPGRRFEISETEFNSLLARYKLNEEGLIQFAGRLFWLSNKNPLLTKWFKEVNDFLTRVKDQSRDNSLGVHWAAARFLLDSQHSETHENDKSNWNKRIELKHIELIEEDGWLVLRHDKKKVGGKSLSLNDLKVIQSGLLEMTIPVVPERLNANWRDVIEKVDILDLPGARASGSNYESVDDEEKVLSVIKRGKVDYLFDRYIDERQIQSLLLLFRGGNQETSGKIKTRVDRWGQNRYGKEKWPRKVAETLLPSLFIGMTGIDDEFKDRSVAANLYEARLSEIQSRVLLEIMSDFYPIRYPGTWDTNSKRRLTSDDPLRWEKAKKAFLETELVQTHVQDAEHRWDKAMDDSDGGLSLISEGLKQTTDNVQKQESLRVSLQQINNELKSLCEPWFVDADSNTVREQRVELAKEVVNWLNHPEKAEERTLALQTALCFEPGHVTQLTEPIVNRASRQTRRVEPVKNRIERELKPFLDEWKTSFAPQQWNRYLRTQKNGALDSGTFNRLANSIHDYITQGDVYQQLLDQIVRIVSLSSDDPMQQAGRKEFTRLVLNDYVTNPGSGIGPLGDEHIALKVTGSLMDAMVQRWSKRLPAALAAGVGERVAIPSGNDELKKILDEASS